MREILFTGSVTSVPNVMGSAVLRRHFPSYLEGGKQALKRPVGTILAVLTILAGAFICVAGTYVFIKVSLFSSIY